MTIDTRGDSQKDPATLEREINQTRSEMNQTLDALERKLSPGQLLDQCLNVFGKQGGDLAQNFGNSVKQNPVPVALTAIGIMWMMFSSGRSSSVNIYDDPSTADRSDTSDPSVTSRATDKLKSTAETIRATATAAQEKLISSKDNVINTVSGVSNKAASGAQAQVRRARDGLSSLLEDQPLVVGALGIALGAAIGAALPPTEQEDRLLGGVRDQTVSKVKELTRDTYDHVRETVKRVDEGVKADIGQPVSDPSSTHS
jgi:hypothetical protein